MGKVSTLNVEKTDGALLYLSKESLNAEIVTAKCSAINVSVPDASGDFVSSDCVINDVKINGIMNIEGGTSNSGTIQVYIYREGIQNGTCRQSRMKKVS